MRLSARIQVNEIYKCVHCEKEFTFEDSRKEWKCPICGEYLYIKYKFDDFEHSVQRINPSDLQIRDLIVLPNDKSWEILNIEQKGNNLRVALKQYGVIEIESLSIVTRVEGGWYGK